MPASRGAAVSKQGRVDANEDAHARSTGNDFPPWMILSVTVAIFL
jgi:hypothetical protein